MPIDIDLLTEEELRDLHHRITERLRVMQQLRAHSAMMEFSIGDRVAFNADGRRVTGVITRYNRKTVTVIADGGRRWNVSPGFLAPAEPCAGRDGDRPPIVVVARPASGGALPPPPAQGRGVRS